MPSAVESDAAPASGGTGGAGGAAGEAGAPSGGSAPSSRFAIAVPLKEATFIPDLDPDADGTGPGPFVTLTGEVASFVAPRALGVAGYPTHLVGSNDDFAVVGNVVLGDVAKKTPRVGCSLIQPPRGGAVAEGDGWLVAASTGAPVGACDEPGPPPAVPTRIDVWRIAPDAGGTYVTSIDAGDQIVDVQTAPHPDGLYVVWSQAALEPAWTIRAARVSGSKNAVVAGPVGVQLPGESSLSFKATAMGDQLAVVRRNDFFGSSPAMHLSVLDEALALVGSGALETEEVLTGPTTALGSRDGRSLLVGYTSSGKVPWRVRIARFDCSPGSGTREWHTRARFAHDSPARTMARHLLAGARWRIGT